MPTSIRLSAVVMAVVLGSAGCKFDGNSTSRDGGGDELPAASASLAAGAPTHDFGSVSVGSQSASAALVVTNDGGGSSSQLFATLGGPQVAAFGIDSDGCTGQSLAAGASCTVHIHFLPSAAGPAAAVLSVGGTEGGAATVSLAGTGVEAGPLAVSPAAQDFGTVLTGESSQATTFSVANQGSGPTGVLSATLTGGDATDYQVESDGCSGQALAAKATCSVGVRFAPGTTGARTASLKVGAGEVAATASLSGTGAAPAAFSLTPSQYDFGSIANGSTSAVQGFTVQNTGGVASVVPAVALAGTNAADFAITANTCTAALDAGATCTFGLTFTPSTAAAESASVAVTAGSATATATLAGTGLADAAIALGPSSHDFGTVAQGTSSATATFTVTNGGGVPTGTLATTLGGTDGAQFHVDSDACNGTTLPSQGQCAIVVHFAPGATQAPGSLQATLQVAGTPGGTTAATLTGTVATPAQLGFTPTSQAFGTVVQGQSSSGITFTLKNTGGVPSGVVSLGLTGTGSGSYAASADTCSNAALGAGDSCTVTVTFAPGGTTLGLQQAALSASASPGGSASSTLTGTAATAAQLGVTPPAGFTGFGTVAYATGPTADAVFTVKNTGGVSTGTLAVTLAGADPGQFGLGADACNGATLASGATCTVALHFAPTTGTVGTEQTTLTVTGSPGGSGTYSATGVAAKPAQLAIAPVSGSLPYVFPTEPQGHASSQVMFNVSNTGGVATGAITFPVTGSNPTDFVVTSNGCTSALSASSSCQIGVTFTPKTTVGESATVTASASPGGTAAAALQGAGATPVVDITFSKASYDFGGVLENTSSSPVTFTVTNKGNIPSGALTLSQSGSTDYVLSGSGAGGCAGVSSLAVNASCTVTVTLTPTIVGAEAASQAYVADPNTHGLVNLTGAGLTSGVDYVVVPWTQSISVASGASGSATYTIVNYGTQTGPTITRITHDCGASSCTISGDDCTGSVLASMGSCTFTDTVVAPLGVAAGYSNEDDMVVDGSGVIYQGQTYEPAQLKYSVP